MALARQATSKAAAPPPGTESRAGLNQQNKRKWHGIFLGFVNLLTTMPCRHSGESHSKDDFFPIAQKGVRKNTYRGFPPSSWSRQSGASRCRIAPSRSGSSPCAARCTARCTARRRTAQVHDRRCERGARAGALRVDAPLPVALGWGERVARPHERPAHAAVAQQPRGAEHHGGRGAPRGVDLEHAAHDGLGLCGDRLPVGVVETPAAHADLVRVRVGVSWG